MPKITCVSKKIATSGFCHTDCGPVNNDCMPDDPLHNESRKDKSNSNHKDTSKIKNS